MKRLSHKDRLLLLFAHAFLGVMALLYFLPFIAMISASITDEKYLDLHGYGLLPGQFSLKAYSFIFSAGSSIPQGYAVSITVTILGTFLSLLVTSMMAYALSRKALRYRGAISFFVFFTMLFQGGLVPYFMVISKVLKLTDTLWVMILPFTVNAFNLILLRTYFSGVDDAIMESAKIDGAKELRVLFSIVIPLALPGVVTIALFYSLQYWNDWFTALLFVNRRELYPLQYLLRQIISTIEFLSSPDAKVASQAAFAIPTKAVRMATTVVTVGPILLLYPFIQKYFIKGLAIGGVKG